MQPRKLLLVCVLSFSIGCLAVVGVATWDHHQPIYVSGVGIQTINDAEGDSAAFVFRAYSQLEDKFYDPEQLSRVDIYNDCLTRLAEALAKENVSFVPDKIDAAASSHSANQQFAQELEKAEAAAKKDLAFIATAALLDAVDDSHTYFMDPTMAERHRDPGKTYYGIGTAVAKLEDNYYYLQSVFTNSPAEKAGLKRFDRLVAIDDKSTPNDLKAIVDMILGPKNTEVKITISRHDQTMDFVVIRDSVQAPMSAVEIIDVDDSRIGYFNMYHFNFEAYFGLVKFIFETHKIQADGIIFDLRDCPGGSILILDEVCDDLLPSGTTYMITERKGDDRESYTAEDGPLTWLPMVVLIDDSSASASEVTASALQDTKRATIVGITSAGAVGVGSEYPLPRGASMVVTVAKIYTAKGVTLEKVGVKPDIVTHLTIDDVKAGRDVQLEKAKEVLKNLIAAPTK